jgi:uncharacterized membrane-anchored protein YhcB (DUF1043 family)
VYSIDTLLLTGIVTLAVGLAVGLLLSRRLNPDNRKQRELERSLDRLLQQQKDYQHEVVEHFTDTSKLLNNLAESYRDVHNHLAAGASALCDDQAGNILSKIPDDSLSEFSSKSELDAVEAPRDYAPKPSPHATGVLNEEFGLERMPEAPEVLIIEEEEVPRQA